MDARKTTAETLSFDLTADGYFCIDQRSAETFFPTDTMLALWRDGSLLLLPTAGAASGGLLLKRRNQQGDRSLLISEVFDFDVPAGSYTADWDEAVGGLRARLPAGRH